MHQRPPVRLVLLLLCFVLAESVPLRAGDTKYLVDSKGEASINVGVKGDAVYKLAPADLAVYRQIRQHLVDLLLAQPAATSPIGVSLWGEAKAGSTIGSGEPNKVGEIQGFPLYRDEHGLEHHKAALAALSPAERQDPGRSWLSTRSGSIRPCLARRSNSSPSPSSTARDSIRTIRSPTTWGRSSPCDPRT